MRSWAGVAAMSMEVIMTVVVMMVSTLGPFTY
jgi:hypothetical protein